MSLSALWFSLALAAVPDAGPALEGFVFLDEDADGRLTARDVRLSGVLVSDGRRIVSTDRDGRFRLPFGPGSKVFLLKPADRLPLPDAQGRLRLWREADPAGEPILFPLVERRDEERLLLFADPQVGHRRDIDFVRRSLEQPLAAEPPACARVVLGDLTADRPELLAELRAVFEDGRVPLLALPGNHDLEPGSREGEDPYRSFRAVFGTERYAFRCGRLRVLMLPGLRPRYREGALSGYEAGFSADDLAFAEAYAAATPAGLPTVIATHLPLDPESGFPADDRARLLAAFAGSPLALVAGHWHRQEIRREPEAAVALFWALGAVSGSYWTGPPGPDGLPSSWMSDGTPRGYGVLAWMEEGFRPYYRPAGQPDRPPLHLFLPRVVEQNAYPSALLSVNLYLGHAESTVRFRVGEGSWQTMIRQPAVDPVLLPILVEQDHATSLPAWHRLPEPRPSTHLWRAPLPTALPEGEHRVEIEAEDGFGSRHRLEGRFRVEARRMP